MSETPITRETLAVKQAELRYDHALWYAWGVIDTSPELGLSTDDAMAFADAHKVDALAYYREEAFMLSGIADAWKAFVATRKG